jgi:hypothetical protein
MNFIANKKFYTMRKLYLFFFAVLFVAVAYAQDYKVVIVSNSLPADDAIIQKFMDEIEGMEGYTAEHLPLANIATATWTNWDACIITENGGSSNMQAFGDAGWPLPVVHLKSYSLYKGTHPILAEANFVSSDKSADLMPGITDLKVKDNADILSCWEVDDVVTWTDGFNTTIGTGAGEAHVQGFNLSAADNPSTEVAAASSVLAETPMEPALSIPTFMWKVEENSVTKRVVAWGIHHDFLENATDDFYTIIKNSVMWVLKKEADISCGVSGYKDLTSANFQVYPNPVANKLNINSAGLINSVNLIDITGKTIMKIQDVNNQHLQIDMSKLSRGLYVIHLTTIEGETFTGKVSK